MRTRGLVVLVAAIALSAFCDLSLAQNAGRNAPIFVAQRTPNQAGQASVDFKNSLFILSSFIALAALTTGIASKDMYGGFQRGRQTALTLDICGSSKMGGNGVRKSSSKNWSITGLRFLRNTAFPN
jgi:hypothetical protein